MFKIDNVESIKKAIRVDHDLDDDLIMGAYLPAAEKEVRTAVSLDKADTAFYQNNAVYNLAVLNLIAHHYDNRSITSNEPVNDVPAASLKLIQTLRADLVNWRKDQEDES
ncbi:head-tail connector protein [Loigolactobacillus rennini]|uniref:DNA packaging protein n=1 Tax=Loigolactobacillus rennini DSM 20253 TaxID=1423796 RepID=A0A0R2CU70_9LACO|nr:head-tail connector protein [Loigolactobacillus rennini]KRM95329.1 hypothetical protein FC24_GL002146 [Loigolactobacillus rennini DSM 20253]